jgi:hypothetical protein
LSGGKVEPGILFDDGRRRVSYAPNSGYNAASRQVKSWATSRLSRCNKRGWKTIATKPIDQLDTESGNQITQLDGVVGIDDLWYDAERKRIYASGGRGSEAGFVYVYQQKDADHYELIARVPTRGNAPGDNFSSDMIYC